MTEIRVQFVVYENETARFARTVESAAVSTVQAIDAGLIDAAHLAIGDCSPTPCLPDDALRVIQAQAEPLGCSHHFFDANLGSAGGSNALWERRETEPSLLLVLNPDTICSPSFVTEVVGAVLKDPRVGMADGRQIPLEHPKSYDPSTLNCSWVSGACTLIRGSVFNEVGGFANEYFPLYCDDVDLSWRVRLAGYRCIHVPTAVVHHDKRPAPDGRPIASELEQYWSVLGALFMTTRWARNDLRDVLIKNVANDGNATHRRALADFEQRCADGTAPSPIAGATKVAEFVMDNYAEHRF